MPHGFSPLVWALILSLGFLGFSQVTTTAALPRRYERCDYHRDRSISQYQEFFTGSKVVVMIRPDDIHIVPTKGADATFRQGIQRI
jgi:hypothetical protein